MNDEQAREDWEKLVSKAVRNQDLYNAKLEVELRQILYADHRIKMLEAELKRAAAIELMEKINTRRSGKFARAERALERAGFEDLGGQEWKPPLGKPPTFIESAPGWVSVDEQEPPKETYLLVSVESEIGQHVIRTFKKKDGSWPLIHIAGAMRVTHWQPLPEPPKSEGE